MKKLNKVELNSVYGKGNVKVERLSEVEIYSMCEDIKQELEVCKIKIGEIKRKLAGIIILKWEKEIKKFYRMNHIGHLYDENNDNILLKSIEMINTLSNMTLHNVFFILNEDIVNELRIIIENTSEIYKEYKTNKSFDDIWKIFDEVYKYFNYLESLYDESNIRDIIWLMDKYRELE